MTRLGVVLLFVAAAAQAAGLSPVRTALLTALGPDATPPAQSATLEEYTKKLQPEIRPKAVERLDSLDRTVLSPVDLDELSRAYALLGANGAAANAGMVLQEREPGKTKGLVLASDAKLQEGDYAGSLALAKAALKIDPKDPNALAAYHAAAGRTAPVSRSFPGTSSTRSAGPSGGSPTPADNSPLRSAMPKTTGHEPPLISSDSGSEPLQRRPWWPYAVGAGLTLFGLGMAFKHAKEQAAEGVEAASENAADGATKLYYKGKDFVQENPKTAIALGVGGAALVGMLVAPTITGGGLMLATAGGGSTSVAIAAQGIGVAQTVTVGAAVAAPMLMSGDGRSAATGKKAHQESKVTVREKPKVSDPELQRAVDKLFQEGDTLPGGTAGAAENEFYTGQQTGSRWHLQAAKERLRWLERLSRARALNPEDKATIELLMRDLRNAIDLYPHLP